MTTSPVDPTGSQSAPVKSPLRRTRNFRNLWLSRVLSVGGSSVTLVAMPVLVYQETKSPFLVSLVAASEALPYVLFGLLAGAVADRAHRRRLMVAADLLNCACVGSVPLAAALDALTPAHVLTAAFLSSTLYVFFDAAGYGLVPAAVGRDRLAEANSALWGGETAVRIAGTAMAGTLIAVTSASGALALDALSFLASALLLRGIGYAPTHRGGGAADRPGLLASIREGVRFLRGHPVLRTMTTRRRPPVLQGRVNTTRRMLSSGLGVPLGALVGSAVTVAVHVRAGLLLAVAAIALASVIVWATRPRARAAAEEAAI
ncbi:MFS transporter [Streptomyces buecherae]|uniref:MFS transporter n=1 Tax=Streptomyces buecherae TaxID=2763006 RepID=UPI0037B642F0